MKNANQIFEAIKLNDELFTKITNRCKISAMILIIDFIIDFDEYYINQDKEISDYLVDDILDLLGVN